VSGEFTLDPGILADIIKASGLAAGIEAILHSLVAAAPLDDAAKANLDGQIDTKVNALVNQLGPEILSALKKQIADSLLSAVATGKGPITDDQSGFA
jgi:hypothetical protein